MIRYLDRGQFARRINVKEGSLSKYKLPEPDALVGDGPKARRGWLPATIDRWNAQRPGRGGWWSAENDTRENPPAPHLSSTYSAPEDVVNLGESFDPEEFADV